MVCDEDAVGDENGGGGSNGSTQPQDEVTDETWKGVTAFPFDREKRSLRSVDQGEAVLGNTHPRSIEARTSAIAACMMACCVLWGSALE